MALEGQLTKGFSIIRRFASAKRVRQVRRIAQAPNRIGRLHSETRGHVQFDKGSIHIETDHTVHKPPQAVGLES